MPKNQLDCLIEAIDRGEEKMPRLAPQHSYMRDYRVSPDGSRTRNTLRLAMHDELGTPMKSEFVHLYAVPFFAGVVSCEPGPTLTLVEDPEHGVVATDAGVA